MNKLSNSPKLKAIKIIIIRSLSELVNDLVLILIFVFLNLFTTKNKKLTIVSAADDSHFYSVQNLFYTLERFEKNSTTWHTSNHTSAARVRFPDDRIILQFWQLVTLQPVDLKRPRERS